MKLQVCSGTDNKFIFLKEDDLLSSKWPGSLVYSKRRELAQVICEKLGSEADGLVVVKRAQLNSGLDFEWDFYNKDGSSAEMCGNAARCMAYYVRSIFNFKGNEVAFSSLAGKIRVLYLEDGNFSVRMPEHDIQILWDSDGSSGNDIKFCVINSGVPHVVLEVPNLQSEMLTPLVKEFRHRKLVGPAGANVSFYSRLNGIFEGVTFERGVEGFTASCGTGAVAIALSIFNSRGPVPQGREGVEIQMPGGILKVVLDPTEKFCWLIGPAGLDREIEIY
jgi:diaminopimelate epimerase